MRQVGTELAKAAWGSRSPREIPARSILGSMVIAGILLTACGPTYQFTPPASQVGQVCIIQCQTSSDQCRALKDQQYQSCQWRHQEAQKAYDACVAANGAMACKGPTGMCFMPNYYECDSRFRTCYQACGGTVTEVQQK